MSERALIFFSKLFPNFILKNKIVATVLNTINKEIATFKIKFDNVLNEDI
jgi:hypothetical protein